MRVWRGCGPMLSLAAAFAERKRKKRRKKNGCFCPLNSLWLIVIRTLRRFVDIYTHAVKKRKREYLNLIISRISRFERVKEGTSKVWLGKVATRGVSPDLRQWYGGEVVYFPSNMASPFGRIGFEGCSTIFASPLSLSPFSSGFVSH